MQAEDAQKESYALENKCSKEGNVVLSSYSGSDKIMSQTETHCLYPCTDISQSPHPIKENQTDVNTEEESQVKDEELAEEKVAVTVGGVLTIRQLVIRRGLTTLLMILILAGGIALNEFLTSLLR